MAESLWQQSSIGFTLGKSLAFLADSEAGYPHVEAEKRKSVSDLQLFPLAQCTVKARRPLICNIFLN